MPNEKILIVEDEGIAAMNLERKLPTLGFVSAGVVCTGEEAVEKVKTTPIDLVLMDIQLAGEMNGITAAEEIQRLRGTPVIFLSAFSDDLTVDRAKRAAPFGYLTKPFQDSSIKTTIEVALNKHRLERRLKESEDNFRALFELSPSGTLLVTREGKIHRANGALARILGTPSPRELEAMQFDELFLPEERGRLTERLRKLHNGEPLREEEFRMARPEGGVFWAQLESSAVRQGEGGELFDLHLLSDISLRKSGEELLQDQADRLSDSNQKLGAFTALASHDLKAPARMAGLYLGLLQREYGDKLDARGRDYIGLVSTEMKKMRALIDDLLEYSKVTRAPSQLQPISLLKVVGDTLVILAPEIEEKRAKVTYDFLPTVNGNEIQLRRLFVNLITNAIKYNRRRPRIHVSAEEKGTELVISVADNGIGVESAERERIFEMFHRGNAEPAFSGTGIGLASCRKVMENHHGRIWVESSGGEGATFRMSFPRVAELAPVAPSRKVRSDAPEAKDALH